MTTPRPKRDPARPRRLPGEAEPALLPAEAEALYREVEEKPADPVPLLALADWYEEQGDSNAADCLRWTARRKRRPYRYNPDEMRITHGGWHQGWYWWARARADCRWGHPAHCVLPVRVWRELRHTFNYSPHVFKEYRSFQGAYEALFAVWPPARPLRGQEDQA